MYLRNRFLGGLSSFALFAPETGTTTTTATTTGETTGTTGTTEAGTTGTTGTTEAPKTTTAETTGTTATTATTTTAPADWRAGLEGEQLEFAKRAASPADVVKIALDLRKANGSMVRVPGADAKPEDVQKFHAAIGVPKTAEEYKPDIGRDLTDADKAVFTPIAKIMHANGVPASAFTAVSKAVHELATAQLQEQERVAVKARADNEAALKKEWGADYDANTTLATRALAQFGGPTAAEFFDKTIVNGQKLGDHPEILRAFGKIGRAMGEGDFIGAVGGDERASVQAKIDQIMSANPPGTEAYKKPEVQSELTRLHEQLHGTGTIVGRGRAA